MFELSHHPIVNLLRDTFRITTSGLNEALERLFHQSVDLAVVVVVVTDAQQCLNVVPNSASEPGRVHIGPPAHRVVGQIVGRFEL